MNLRVKNACMKFLGHINFFFTQNWALAVFFNFSIMRNDILSIFNQLNLTGGRLLK